MQTSNPAFDVYRTVLEEQKSISPTKANHPCLFNVGVFLVAILMGIPDYTGEAV